MKQSSLITGWKSMTSDTVKLAYLTDRSGFDCIVFAFKSMDKNPETLAITFTDVLAIQAEFDEEKEKKSAFPL